MSLVSPMVLDLIYGRPPSGFFHLSNISLMLILFSSAFTDLLARTVPNGLVILGLGLALLFAISKGLMGLGAMLIGLTAGMLMFMPIYLVGMLGAGDVKLFGVVGAFLGLHQLLISALLIFVAGGLFSLLTAYRSRRSETRPQVPYAAAIATGVFAHLTIFA